MINLAAHSEQRVGIFIDTQNLYHSAKTKHRANVNYVELIEAAVSERSLIRAFAYVIKSSETTEEKFFDALEDIGIEIRIKDLQIFHTGVKKADWDVGIAVDMIRMSDKLDTIVLASGDGDFLEVIRYCQSKGVRVEVMAFEKTTNAAIIDEADYFVDLGGSNGKYLLKGGRKYSRSTPKKQTHQEIYSPNNLPAYVRANKVNDDIDESIYGTKGGSRKVKPVVGLPGSQKKIYIARNNNQTDDRNIENAFGNPREKL